MLIDWFFLQPSEEIRLTYKLQTLPIKFWYIQVGLFEEWELGDDVYGDIILKPDNLNCWKEADIYTSVSTRSYTEGKTTPTCDEDKLALPDNIAQNAIDEDNNGIPDYIDALTSWTSENLANYSQWILDELYQDSDGDGVPDSMDPFPNTDENSEDFMSSIANINDTVDEISEELDTIIEWFGCGFGGGSCIATPLNWAPLAPGWDPTLFGMPIGDGLKVNEGIPIFSAITWINIPTPSGCYQAPAVWPLSPFQFTGVCNTTFWAWGSLWVTSPANSVRLFATPTLTWGFWTAACFWGPAIVAGYSNPPWIHPIVPGGNCIVAAVPLLWCQGDEGDPRVTGYPSHYRQYGIINANCPVGTGSKWTQTLPEEIDNNFVRDYLRYKKTWIKSEALVSQFRDAFSRVAEWWGNWNTPGWPLVNVGGGSEVDMSLAVDFDPSALAGGSFTDVIQIQNTRISAFPDFLMDWVTRQLEEVVTKLTSLPKVFLILPDFSGIFDYGWGEFGENTRESFEKWVQETQQRKADIQGRIDGLKTGKSRLSCLGDDSQRCGIIDLEISRLEQKKDFQRGETVSGIRTAFEFLWNIPLVSIEPETINVNIPWPGTPEEISRTLQDWKYTRAQWGEEISRVSDLRRDGRDCSYTIASKQEKCERENEFSKNLEIDTRKFLQSFDRNIEILEDYADMPKHLNKLVSIKEVRLEQVLCNVEAISSFIGDWISKNGERFKAWIELFILIKSILKSWQLLIDVFKWYDEECHQCKNERQDLQSFIWKMISAVLPKLPIIQFPKWPDIVLDLHNVRAGMSIYLPDFNFNLRPIVLPTLPNLTLPDIPSLDLTIPDLPILPEFEIPDLPEFPTLPSVELPDLPPPPKIPKLFGAVEWILNIMKLITKVMCIIKTSPFVPEWRAGDQIAYITERNGYIATDFIDISLPQFSYPFVDAIKVTSFVNFEFETEFILESVRQITAPLDVFTNDITNMFKIAIPDLDFSGYTPDNIDVNVELDGDTNINGEDISFNGTQKGFEYLGLMFAKKLQQLIIYVDSQKDVTLTNKEFVAYVHKNLATKSVTENPRMDEIRKIWEEVNNFTYSKEQAFIEKLLENKDEKFRELENIISTEIEKAKIQKQKLKNLGTPSYTIQVSFEDNDDIWAYNRRLEWYNHNFIKSAIQLVNGEEENPQYTSEIASAGEEMIQEIRWGFDSFRTSLENPKLLASSHESNSSDAKAPNSCSYGGGSEYKYTYEGLYVLEYDRHYRLFEYLDDLRGDEYTTPIDIDGDDDEDLIYMMNNHVYIKENLKNKNRETYVSLPPIILQSWDNLFYNGDTYFEAINGFREANVSSNFINISFNAPTDLSLNFFRLEFFTIVDKFRNLEDSDYIPSWIKKFVVDSISDVKKNTLLEKQPWYILWKSIAYISSAWVIPWAILTNEKLINITTNLANNDLVSLTSWAKLYAGNTRFKLKYYVSNEEDIEEIRVEAHTYIEFAEIVHIVGISGNAYTESGISEDIKWSKIVQYIGKPLLPWAKIRYEWNDVLLNESSHIDITYYDNSIIGLDMREVSDYRLYDLWKSDEQHLIRLQLANDFYYGKIHALKNGIKGTSSQQILLSPQIQADTEPPQIALNQKIRIPVYQKKIINLTPYIYENLGITNIVDVQVDFDLQADNNSDGDTRNDRDLEHIRIIQNPINISIEFGEYQEIFERKIRISLVDRNGNIGYQDIDFEVYPPAPQIQSYENEVISGVIDETLLEEPVRIYRYRGGVIKKLHNITGSDVVDTTSSGAYDFWVSETWSGLVLKQDGVAVALVNEYTGKITLQNPSATIQMLASNDSRNTDGFPRILVYQGGEEVFHEYIQPKFDPEIEIIESLNDINSEGIYVRILNQQLYRSATIPLGVSFNPGTLILYFAGDKDKKAVFSVFRDGRVYSGDIERYTLKYKNAWERSSYILRDEILETDIAQVILDIDASYILK